VGWPSTLRIEVKFSTTESAPFPARELDILASGASEDCLGIVAVLFRDSGAVDDGCQWLIVDAVDLAGRCSGPVQAKGETLSIGRERLDLIARGQDRLNPIRERVASVWPKLLKANLRNAIEGQGVLRKCLEAAHRVGSLNEDFPARAISRSQLREWIDRLLEEKSESDVGRIMQELFGYCFAVLGYPVVTINQVGVPDVLVESFHGAGQVPADDEWWIGPFGQDQIASIVQACEQADEVTLARMIRDRATKNRTSA
jgi:hypothetical protein